MKKSRKVKKAKVIWTTAYGEDMTLKQIKNDHLMNILRHLVRRKVYQDLKARLYVDNLFGDSAEIYADYQAGFMERQTVSDRFPVFTTLLAEAKRRKLVKGA